MKKEEAFIGLDVNWDDKMGHINQGKIVAFDNDGLPKAEHGTVAIIELFGGTRKWAKVENLSRKP